MFCLNQPKHASLVNTGYDQRGEGVPSGYGVSRTGSLLAQTLALAQGTLVGPAISTWRCPVQRILGPHHRERCAVKA
jgi:hypothetical protein